MYLRPLFALLAAGLACALAGCGGGGGSSDSAPSGPTGQARFTILWPAPAAHAQAGPRQSGPRLIPAAANSIVVALAGTGAPPPQTLTRPAQGQPLTSTATFTNLPPEPTPLPPSRTRTLMGPAWRRHRPARHLRLSQAKRPR